MRRVLRSSAIILLGQAAFAPAQAQQAPALEEIVVTAQKREESLQNAPISIVAFTNRDLEQKSITSLNDLRSLVPNLQMSPHPNSSATTLVVMRGIGITDDQISQDAPTAIYVDGIYVGRSQGLASDLAELSRIEVLRGPQGSLYGRNANAGAVNFVTQAPALGEWGFRQQFSFGNRAQFRSKTMVNVPLGDTAAARLSYLKADQHGFVRNLGTGAKRFGDRGRQAWRADLAWQPTDAIDVRYGYDRSELNDTPAFVASVPLFPAVAARPSAGSPLVRDLKANDVTAQGHSLIASWRLLDGLTAKSITGYRKLANFQNENYLAGVVGPGPLFSNASQINQDQWSEELQLLGDSADKSLQYILGFYYFDEAADLAGGTLTLQAPTTQSQTVSAIANRAIAFFGQATWSPNALDQRAHLTGGLRWSRDHRQATLVKSNRDTVSGSVTPVPGVGDGDRKFSNVSPTVILAYDLTEQVNLFAKMARGYKTGGYNIRASSTTRFNEGFGEETLTSWEAGVKSQFWDNRARLNATAFRGLYKDVQVNLQSDPTNPRLTDVLNAGRATVQGLELDGSVALTRGLTVSGNYAYLDARYKEVIDATGRNVASNFNFLAPKHSYTLSVAYQTPMLPFGMLSANLDRSWQTRKFANSTGSALVIGSYGLWNARLTLSDIPGIEGLRVAGWAKNLGDKNHYIGHFSLGTGINAAIFGEPRSFGLDVIYEF